MRPRFRAVRRLSSPLGFVSESESDSNSDSDIVRLSPDLVALERKRVGERAVFSSGWGAKENELGATTLKEA